MDDKTKEPTVDFLKPQRLRFHRNCLVLRLTIEGVCSYPNVSVLRSFPLSHPDRYLSIRDGEGNEIGVLADPTPLDDDSRKLVMNELERRYLVPVVRSVISVKEWFGTVEWCVDTNRGKRTFTTRNLRENTVQPSPGRYLLSDVDGNRFDIKDLSALDRKSQSLLIQHL